MHAASDDKFHATTVIAVRRDGKAAMAGDGQVTLGSTVVKGHARKVRAIGGGRVLAGFAGAQRRRVHAARALRGASSRSTATTCARAAVELAKDWRTDRFLRRLEAMLIVDGPREHRCCSAARAT